MEGNVTYTVIEMNDNSFDMVPDDQVEARLAALNEGIKEQQKQARVYSKSGLTKAEAEETIHGIES